jgi:ankyrin repeat protein
MRCRQVICLCGLVLLGCHGKQEVANTAPAFAPLKLPAPVKNVDGITIAEYGSNFANRLGSPGKMDIASFARIDNHTKKTWAKITVAGDVTWGSLPDKLHAEIPDWDITPYGYTIDLFLPPGGFCFTPPLRFPIEDEQWRLDYNVTFHVVDATELDPKLCPDNDLAIQAMAASGDTAALSKAVDARPELKTFANGQGASLLDLAVLSGNIDTVKALEDRGMKLEDRCVDGRSALHFAALANAKMVKYVLKKVPTFDADNRHLFPLSMAIFSGNVGTAGALIDAGASLDDLDQAHTSAIFCAINSRSPEMIRFVVKRGAKVKVFDSMDFSPIAYAIFHRYYSLLDTIWEVDKNINVQAPHNRYTPLHLAVYGQSYVFAKWCLQHGADRTIKNKFGETPMDMIKKVSNEMDRQRMQMTFDGRDF